METKTCGRYCYCTYDPCQDHLKFYDAREPCDPDGYGDCWCKRGQRYVCGFFEATVQYYVEWSMEIEMEY